MRPSIVALFVVLACALARADVPPPESEPCIGKATGAACSFGGKNGTCAESTCTRATPNGGVPYACTKCDTSASSGTTTQTEATDSKSSGCASAGAFAAGLFGLMALRRRRG